MSHPFKTKHMETYKISVVVPETKPLSKVVHNVTAESLQEAKLKAVYMIACKYLKVEVNEVIPISSEKEKAMLNNLKEILKMK